MSKDQYLIPREKVLQMEALLKKKEIDALLILSREGSDDNLSFFTGVDSIDTAGIIIDSKGEHQAVTSVREQKNFEESKIFKNVIPYFEEMGPVLQKTLEDRSYKTLGLNISEEESVCDGLTLGLYNLLAEFLGPERLLEMERSSEELLITARSKKTPGEIEKIRKVVEMTNIIYDEVFDEIRVGMSEVEIADLFIKGLKRHGVTSGIGDAYDYPIVCLVRAGLAHRQPGNTKSIPGDLLIIDLSVKYEGYVSDIARTGYFLKEEESEPPLEVSRAFQAAYEAITKAIDYIKPGVKGYEVDQVARKVIEDWGYPTVRHSVGHQIGRLCHETGTLLSPRKKRSEGIIQEDEIYAIEPTVIQDEELPCMLVEENVLITKNGREVLSSRQKELYLILFS